MSRTFSSPEGVTEYRTRDGRKAWIYRKEELGRDENGVDMGHIYIGELDGKLIKWTSHGWYAQVSIKNNINDLFDLPKTWEVDVWVNLYENGNAYCHDSKCKANNCIAQSGYIKTIKKSITLEV